MSTFDDRENAFEAKFAHDQEKEFRAEMMALRQIAVWGVSVMQISPQEKEHRTAALQSLEMQKGTKALILAQLADDLSGMWMRMRLKQPMTCSYGMHAKKWGSPHPIKDASNIADCLKRTGCHPDYGFQSPRPKSPWWFGAQVH